ncbi:MAG TPA: hypothetical protein VFR63_11630 [Gaiellaceae bacterium]|nr:hypothetical protein [Gaiellaceae bacterium]
MTFGDAAERDDVPWRFLRLRVSTAVTPAIRATLPERRCFGEC